MFLLRYYSAYGVARVFEGEISDETDAMVVFGRINLVLKSRNSEGQGPCISPVRYRSIPFPSHLIFFLFFGFRLPFLFMCCSSSGIEVVWYMNSPYFFLPTTNRLTTWLINSRLFYMNQHSKPATRRWHLATWIRNSVPFGLYSSFKIQIHSSQWWFSFSKSILSDKFSK